MKIISKKLPYLAAFCILLIVEVLIALFVRDDFIRPYVGDMLVTVLLCNFGRLFTCSRLLVPAVFAFSVLVEVGQYFDIVKLLGLDGSRFFSILIGSTFSWADIICYGVGCALFYAAECVIIYVNKHKMTRSQ